MILYYCPTENRRLSRPYWLHTKTVYLPADGYWTYISVLISTAGASTGQESSTCWSLTISRRKKERPDVEQLRWSGPMHYLIFSDQIWSLSKSCYSHIWEVCCIRPYLNSKTASTIAASIVHSKLDYCNSVYYNLPKVSNKSPPADSELSCTHCGWRCYIFSYHTHPQIDVTKVTKHHTVRTGAKYRSWVLVKCVWCSAYYWFWLRKGTGYGFYAFLTCILLLLLLIRCKISLYLGPVWPVRCFVTPILRSALAQD